MSAGALRDAMIDLETWGQHAPCAIRSIGMVVFDPHSRELGDEFYCNVTKESCLAVGLTVLESTEQWWARQDREAQKVLESDQISIRDALKKLGSFWRARALTRPWSQGANFDQPIIEEAFRRCEIPIPWRFWDSRCTRTAYGMAGIGRFDLPKFDGTPHYALDDARHQARCVQLAHERLGLHDNGEEK